MRICLGVCHLSLISPSLKWALSQHNQDTSAIYAVQTSLWLDIKRECMKKKVTYAAEQFDLPTCKKINLRTHHKELLMSLKPSFTQLLCFCSQPWLKCYFCVFEFSHGKPFAGWQSTIHMDWVQKDSRASLLKLLTLQAESIVCSSWAGFHFTASFKSGWALILLFLQPNNGKSRHWMRVWGVTAGLWFLLIKNTDCAYIHLGNLQQRNVKMTKLRSQMLSFPMFPVQH